MSREPIPTWYFSLVVVRKGDRFLVVHERKHGLSLGWLASLASTRSGDLEAGDGGHAPSSASDGLARPPSPTSRWWLPGGRVEAGESLAEAALRECLEESGVPIVLEGLLRLEHSPTPDSARVRAVFLARPADDTPPKSVADEHSLEAAWRTLDELEALRARGELRGEGFLAWFHEVASGRAVVAPLSVLGEEGPA